MSTLVIVLKISWLIILSVIGIIAINGRGERKPDNIFQFLLPKKYRTYRKEKTNS